MCTCLQEKSRRQARTTPLRIHGRRRPIGGASDDDEHVLWSRTPATCYNPQVPIRPCTNPSNRAICLHADYKVIRWNGSKRKVRTYRLTYLLGLFSLFFPGRVALHPFSAHYYITSSNNDGRKQKHTPHYLQCFNSDAGRRRNETGSPQTDQSMSNRSGGMKATATGNVRREQP